MINRKVIALGALAWSVAIGAVIMGADAKNQDFSPHESYDPAPPFQEAMDKANDRARGDPQAMDKADKEGEAARDTAGVGHKGDMGLDGSISPDKGTSVGGSISKDGAEVHIKVDTDKAEPANHDGGAGDGADHSDHDFDHGGFAGSDSPGRGDTV